MVCNVFNLLFVVRIEKGRATTLYMGTSFIVNGNIVNGNIVKWGTKQVFGNYKISSITVRILKWGTKQVFGNNESSSITVLFEMRDIGCYVIGDK